MNEDLCKVAKYFANGDRKLKQFMSRYSLEYDDAIKMMESFKVNY